MTPRRTAYVRHVRTASGIALCAVATAWGCDSLLTRPSLYGTVHVSVARRNGDPIPGAGLTLYTGQRPMGYAATDSAGVYDFVDVPEGGVYGVLAYPPAGYVRLEELVGGAATDVAQNLVPVAGQSVGVHFSFFKKGLGTLVAQVTEPSGTPIANIPLTLYTGLGPLRAAVTAADGQFTFDALPLGNYGVFATTPAAYLDSAEKALANLDAILIEDGSRETAAFRFTPCNGTIAVTVRDDAGLPVPGAQITLYDATRVLDQSPTNTDGTRLYQKLGCAVYGVRVRPPPGWLAPEARGVSYTDALWIHRGGSLAAVLTLQTCQATLRLRVEDQAGVPVPNARVVIYTADSLYRDVNTPANGQIVAEKLPCDREYGTRVVPPDGFTVAEAFGSSYYDGIRFTNGAIVDRVFRLTRR
jgi:hypothetical protein